MFHQIPFVKVQLFDLKREACFIVSSETMLEFNCSISKEGRACFIVTYT